MLRFIQIFVFLTFICPPLYAQTLEGQPGPGKTLVQTVLQQFVIPAVELRPQSERQKLENTIIRIVPGGPFPGPRAGIDQGQRLIILPEIFLAKLDGFIEAEFYGIATNRPHFSEWWVDYALWRSPIFPSTSFGNFYQGPAPKLPLEFAGLTPTDAANFRSSVETGLSGGIAVALIDVLLHELAHHAMDDWYVPGQTSNQNAQQIEKNADQWATNAFYNFAQTYLPAEASDRKNALGRVFSIGLVHALNRWTSSATIDPGDTHPNHASRIASSLGGAPCDTTSTLLEDTCELIKDRIATLNASVNLKQDYQNRAQNGEGFAHMKLAQIAFGQGNFSKGCDHAIEASNRTDRRANQYAGWCIEFGHSFQSLSNEQQKKFAVGFYKSANDAGWADSKAALIRYGVQP